MVAMGDMVPGDGDRRRRDAPAVGIRQRAPRCETARRERFGGRRQLSGYGNQFAGAIAL